MKVTYDKRAGGIYIQVSDEPSSFGVICHTKELVSDTVLVDYLPSGEVYGIGICGIDCIEDITDKKVKCPYVGGDQPDCIDTNTEKCKSCVHNRENRREISYYSEVV